MKNIILILALIFPLLGFSQSKFCEVSFSYELSTLNQNIKFIPRTIDTNKIVNWKWDFGDGVSSNIQNPKHIYSQSGTYIVCLTIFTIDSCESTFCDTLKVESAINYYSISGKVIAGTVPLPYGVVLLIDADNYKAVKYSIINVDNNGHYEFSQIEAGNYIIYAIPNFDIDINYYPSYLPTYLGSTTKWQDANILSLSSSIYNQDISLSCNTDILYGPDTILGNIKILDANSFEYNIYYNNWFGNVTHNNINLEIAPNVPVLLLNSDNEPIRFTLTDSTGNFTIKNLPINIYKIAPEKAGLITFPATIDFTTTSSSILNTNLFIATSNIYSIISENNYEISNDISIFPNPVKDNINILLKQQIPIFVTLQNIEGKILQNYSIINSKEISLPVNNLSSGIYFIKVQTEGSSPLIKKVIIQ